MSEHLDAAIESAERWLSDHPDVGKGLADQIFDLAEPGLCEINSARLLWSALEQAGFTIENDAAGLPTSWVARFGQGRPVIGLMCENDAVPGSSQRPVSHRSPVSPSAPGFTDLHNGIGAASATAALAIKAAMVEHDLPGTLVVYGTAAEKLCIGKPFLARDGYFEDVDAVVAWHPRNSTTVEWDTGPCCYRIESFVFSGTPGYGARPWNAVSALDATAIMKMAVELARKQLPPEIDASVNEFHARGGMHPTEIPGTCEVWYVMRARTLDGMDRLRGIVERAAEAASVAIGTRHEIRTISATRPWIPNHSIGRLAYRHLERIGAPAVPAGMEPFAKSILENLGITDDSGDELFNPHVIDPEMESTYLRHSGTADDVTEFCWHAPTVRIYVAYGLNRTGLPSWAAQGAFARTEAAHATIGVAARAVAGTAVELFTDPDALAAAQAEHAARLDEVGGFIPPLVPLDARAPITLEDAPRFVLDYLIAHSDDVSRVGVLDGDRRELTEAP